MSATTEKVSKYVFVSNYWPPEHRGGFEVGCMRLAEELAGQGHKIFVVTSSRVPVSDTFKICSTLLHYDPSHSFSRRFVVSILNSLILRLMIFRINPSQLLFFGLQNVGYLVLFQSFPNRCKRFVYCSDETYVHWDDICRRILKNRTVIDRLFCCFFKLLGISYSNVRDVHGIHTSAYIRRVTPTIFSTFRKNAVLHWGVNAKSIDLSTSVTEKCRISLGGRICQEKGIDIGLESILSANDRYPGCIDRVTLLGRIPDNPYGRRIRSLLASLQKVGICVEEKVVSPPQVLDELSDSNCFLLPSVWDEPFSIMLLEAMSARNFCVVTDTGGSGEICSHLVTGYLCSNPSVSDVSDGISWFIQNRLAVEHIRDNARAAIVNNYSMTYMSSRFVSLTSEHWV